MRLGGVVEVGRSEPGQLVLDALLRVHRITPDGQVLGDAGEIVRVAERVGVLTRPARRDVLAERQGRDARPGTDERRALPPLDALHQRRPLRVVHGRSLYPGDP
jgi:hypothetical protein